LLETEVLVHIKLYSTKSYCFHKIPECYTKLNATQLIKFNCICLFISYFTNTKLHPNLNSEWTLNNTNIHLTIC